MLRIALCDTLHLHKRNFASLFEMFQEQDITPSILLDRDDDGYNLITCSGNYEDIEQHVSPFVALSVREHASSLAKQPVDELYESEMLGLRLWPLCRSELMSYLLSQDSWQAEVMLKDDRALFEKAFVENHADLTLNISIAKYWLNHWYHNRKKIFSHNACCVFSGSSIYTRTLLELLRRSQCRAFVLESTFTGNDFLFEEMYQPIANNLGVRHHNTRVSRRDPQLETIDNFEREAIKARNKIISANNKNVKQPASRKLPQFPTDQEQILILGQVANDYSLIEDGFPYVGSIPVYRELIQKILKQTSYNIVFKSHPWEHKKSNIKRSFTFDTLAEFVRGLPDTQRSRVLLVEDTNLQDLLNDSTHFVTFCSQSGIEAAMNGLRPIVLGRAFYSNAGFTQDCANIDDVITALNTSDGTLNLNEYQSFTRFVVDLFQYGSFSIFQSGRSKLLKALEKPKALEQKSPLWSELSLRSSNLSHRATPKQWAGIVRRLKPLEDPDTAKMLADNLSISLLNFPASFNRSDQNIQLILQVVNHSEYAIPRMLMNRECFASYHIYDEHGGRYIWNGERKLLNEEIQQEFRDTIPFKIPDEAGKYSIVPALLFNSICWLNSDQTWEFEVV